MKKRIEDNRTVLLMILLTIIVVISISVMKYRSGEINYNNSDATWHTILTMQAYEETPISYHKFLPIVSFGNEDDKFISWGGTIPDQYGNYYYTSFSPVGFVLPYFFVKLFHLPMNEESIYVFNSLLFLISAVLWGVLLGKVYDENTNKFILLFIGTLTYIFSPELFHGMGIVYWHQSVMQVTLLIQLLAYYSWKRDCSSKAKVVFFIMTLINPYIEWTGYVANAGFAMVELINYYKNKSVNSIKSFFQIVFVTGCSFVLFSLHYLCVVDTKEFLRALKNRFLDRSFASTTKITDVFCGYIQSFRYLWVLLLILIIWNIVKSGKVEIHNRTLIFITLIFLGENIIMKQHAFLYSYDRMKMVFVLSFLVCELTNQILSNLYHNKNAVSLILCIITITCCYCNYHAYTTDKKYIWTTDYRENNEKIVSYINDNYSDNILTTNTAVRGYLSCLVGRGIYEQKTINSAIEIAKKTGKKYAIELLIGENDAWNMYELSRAIVYEIDTGKYRILEVSDAGEILSKEIDEKN